MWNMGKSFEVKWVNRTIPIPQGGDDQHIFVGLMASNAHNRRIHANKYLRTTGEDGMAMIRTGCFMAYSNGHTEQYGVLVSHMHTHTHKYNHRHVTSDWAALVVCAVARQHEHFYGLLFSALFTHLSHFSSALFALLVYNRTWTPTDILLRGTFNYHIDCEWPFGFEHITYIL